MSDVQLKQLPVLNMPLEQLPAADCVYVAVDAAVAAPFVSVENVYLFLVVNPPGCDNWNIPSDASGGIDTVLLTQLGRLYPTLLKALTVNVYGVQVANPPILIGLTLLFADTPVLDVAVYVITFPPVSAFAVNVTHILPATAVAVPIVGIPGKV